MATIQIKRSTNGDVPGSNLAAGELAYTFGTSGTGPERLFIGSGTANFIIGGKIFTDMLDHTAGTLTASSALIADSNNKVDTLKLKGADNSTPGNVVLDDNDGTHATTLKGAATLAGNINVNLPSTAGTLVGTGDTGSVTNGMLAGSIDLTAKVTGVLPVANGGTGLSSYTAGDMTYYASGTAITKLNIGTNGQFMSTDGTAPSWTNIIDGGSY